MDKHHCLDMQTVIDDLRQAILNLIETGFTEDDHDGLCLAVGVRLKQRRGYELCISHAFFGSVIPSLKYIYGLGNWGKLTDERVYLLLVLADMPDDAYAAYLKNTRLLFRDPPSNPDNRRSAPYDERFSLSA